MTHIKTCQPSLIIFEASLSDIEAKKTCQQIRSVHPHIPIILIPDYIHQEQLRKGWRV